EAAGGDVRTLASDIRGRLGERPAVVSVIGTAGDKPALVGAANRPAQERGENAGNLLQAGTSAPGGRRGGNADIAQGGGRDAARADAGLDERRPSLESSL